MILDVPLIIVLYNHETKVTHGEPRDIIALQYTGVVARCIYDALLERGYEAVLLAVDDSLSNLHAALKNFSPETTFIFNNCDGFQGDNLAVTGVVHLIERLGFRHTGSTAEVVACCINKLSTKQKLIASGVPTPRYQVYQEPGAPFRWQFPAIVKPLAGDASLGIDLQAVVLDSRQLIQRVSYVIEHYRQPALVEEFIPGREVAVALWGNGKTTEVLPISEHDFSSLSNPLHHLLTYEAKWVLDSYQAKNIITRCPAALNREEREYIAAIGRKAFRALGLRDLGRIDIRYCDGIPYVIDVNEIPDLAPDAGFAFSAYAAGYAYAEMIEHIVEIALQRDIYFGKSRLSASRPRMESPAWE